MKTKDKVQIRNSTIDFLTFTRDAGKTYQYKFYALKAIIAVGYRINSERATQFRQWATEKLDAFLQFNDAEILKDKGKVTAAIAKQFAESEFEQYRILQDRVYQSDFDRLMVESETDLK